MKGDSVERGFGLRGLVDETRSCSVICSGNDVGGEK